MQLSLNLTFELKRSSRRGTTQPDGTQRAGDHENTISPRDSAVSLGGSKLKAACLSHPCQHAFEASKTIDKHSSIRGLGRKLNRMFNRSSRTASSQSNDIDSYGNMQEVKHRRVSELPGTELSPNFKTEQTMARNQPSLMYSELPDEAVTEAPGYRTPSELPSSTFPRHVSLSTSYDDYQQQSHVPNDSHLYDGYYQPSDTKGSDDSQSPFYAVPNSATSTAFSAAGPPPYSSGPNETDRYDVWPQNASVDRRENYTDALPTYPFSPPYEQQQRSADENSFFSPVTDHQGQSGYSGSTTFPPTPPKASPSDPSLSFSPTEALQHSFEGIPSAPVPHTTSRQNPSTALSSNFTEHATTHAVLDGSPRFSHWERHSVPMNRVYNPDATNLGLLANHDASFDGMDHPFSSFPPATSPSLHNNATQTLHAMPPVTTPNRQGQRSFFAKGLRRIPSIVCRYCTIEFNGEYQKGNMMRHIRSQHLNSGGNVKLKCRSCPAEYKRADARRKHEWKEHGHEDCRPGPERRRVKKMWEEKRIYMPNSESVQSVTG